MKTRMLLFALLFFNMGVFAQQKGWTLGGYGYVGSAGFGYPTVESAGNAGAVYQFGVVSRYHFSKRFALGLGLGYSHAKESESAQTPAGFPTFYGDKYEMRFKHTDLVVPVDLLVDLGQRPEQGFYAFLGATFGIRLSREAVQTTYLYRGSYSNDLTNTVEYPGLDVFNTLGLGYAFQFKSGTRLFVQYSGSSNAVTNLLNWLGSSSGDVRDRAVVNWHGLGVGVMSPLTKAKP